MPPPAGMQPTVPRRPLPPPSCVHGRTATLQYELDLKRYEYYNKVIKDCELLVEAGQCARPATPSDSGAPAAGRAAATATSFNVFRTGVGAVASGRGGGGAGRGRAWLGAHAGPGPCGLVSATGCSRTRPH